MEITPLDVDDCASTSTYTSDSTFIAIRNGEIIPNDVADDDPKVGCGYNNVRAPADNNVPARAVLPGIKPTVRYNIMMQYDDH